ncbi:MAG: WecB/TagA/CpsF family glycosyltransferase [Trueperaceae bacterium]|nr:MAG: WecB/TagA/CpsF family glycosyltransferase [Trueperaceae bacterium]
MATFIDSTPDESCESVGNVKTVDVLGYRVATCTVEQAAHWVIEATEGLPSKLLITLNPEIVVRAQIDRELHQTICGAELIVADGIGVVWAARRSGQILPERVPGVDLTTRILELGGQSLRVYLLGAEPGIAAQAADYISNRYHCTVVGTHHGYFNTVDEIAEVVAKVRSSRPHLLLAGLGEDQELFLQRHRDALGVPVMIGVGGTLDVLAGAAKRTPAWTRRVGLEWAWRVGFDPNRWHRLPRLLRFVRIVCTRERSNQFL